MKTASVASKKWDSLVLFTFVTWNPPKKRQLASARMASKGSCGPLRRSRSLPDIGVPELEKCWFTTVWTSYLKYNTANRITEFNAASWKSCWVSVHLVRRFTPAFMAEMNSLLTRSLCNSAGPGHIAIELSGALRPTALPADLALLHRRRRNSPKFLQESRP